MKITEYNWKGSTIFNNFLPLINTADVSKNLVFMFAIDIQRRPVKIVEGNSSTTIPVDKWIRMQIFFITTLTVQYSNISDCTSMNLIHDQDCIPQRLNKKKHNYNTEYVVFFIFTFIHTLSGCTDTWSSECCPGLKILWII